MNRTTLTRSLTTQGALLALAFALAGAPGLRAQAPPSAGAAPAGQKAGPPTETGFVVLARDSSLLISSVPMGQAFAVPGGGTFVSGAPKGDAGKKPDGGRAGELGGTWVAAGGDAGRGTGAAAGGTATAAPAQGPMMMVTAAPGGSEGEPKLTRFITNTVTKGLALLKEGERVIVQYKMVDGERVATSIALPEKDKKD